VVATNNSNTHTNDTKNHQGDAPKEETILPRRRRPI
jgi:hypothetical protein